MSQDPSTARGDQPNRVTKPVVIGMMAFAVMNFMTVVSLRGLPAQAEYGLVSIFYYIFAAVVFLIPTALVAAELASTFPKQGGVFRWVGEAFGPRWGFAAVYWQWQAWVLWLPAVLVFGAAAVAFILWPQSFDAALAKNKLYSMVVLLVVFWAVTVFTFRGIQASVKLSTISGIFGTIVPGAILIVLAGVYVAMGKPIQMSLHTGFLPDFGELAQHGPGRQHLPLLCRHGNAGRAREESEEPFAGLSTLYPDRDDHDGHNFRARYSGRRCGDSTQVDQSGSESAGCLSGFVE